ncbi:STAS domain-containing protein [Actinoplanes sp. Pm04-4]|uniref:STAS domain-containing protein n=1 Tax=Paractinoplanes pyxinae TaxID=2997416 RepID=A0ABT4B6E8_9ACTN|nr:STAS domain-containing protein [Actinoplanes pyxinae]MCY1141612.1 STAS domain-containing protein [Actinoplanes pyxinae]
MRTFPTVIPENKTAYPAPALTQTVIIVDADTVRLSFTGDLDADTAPQFSQAIRHALNFGPAWVQIDLAAVGFLAAAGIRSLLLCHRYAADQGSRLTIDRPQPLVRHVLQVTGVLGLLTEDPIVT